MGRAPQARACSSSYKGPKCPRKNEFTELRGACAAQSLATKSPERAICSLTHRPTDTCSHISLILPHNPYFYYLCNIRLALLEFGDSDRSYTYHICMRNEYENNDEKGTYTCIKSQNLE